MMLMTETVSMAQNNGNVNVSEPDTVWAYYILTSDSTCEILPTEIGSVKEHRNKVSKMMKLVKKAAGGASTVAAGMGIAKGGSAIGSAMKMMNTAGQVSAVGSMVDGLAGQVGNDIAFDGVQSAYKVKPGKKDIRILFVGETNENDFGELFRVVRFYEADGDRRIQWMEIKPQLLGKKETRKDGYIGFVCEKYRKRGFLITIPNNQLEKGEYGIVLSSAASSIGIPVPTFSVK